MIALAGSFSLASHASFAAKVQQTFSYDAAGRLTDVKTDSGQSEVSLNEHYKFDASGNIIEKTVDGQTVRMTYDAGNQLMSRTDAAGTVHFVYDSAGRLISERMNGQTIAQYEYGYLDKVTQVTRGSEVTEFNYNARGMLVAKERDGKIIETFGWDGIGLIAKDETVYVNESHVSGGVPLAAIDAADQEAELQYYDSDYLGTTTAVYSAEGDVEAKLVGSYGAGGESDELRFTGKPYDADLDAHVFPYRNYRADVGRWVSADPAGFPDGPNQHYYAPVPTMGLDPLGLEQYSSLDFIGHFYWGNGNNLLLESAGYLQGIKNEVVDQEISKRFGDQILEEAKNTAPSTGEFAKTFQNAYSFSDVHYVFGSATLSGSFEGNLTLDSAGEEYDTYSYTGTAAYSFLDIFSDPADLLEAIYGTSNPTEDDNAPEWLINAANGGGDPYNIIGSWSETISGTFEI